jgi:DNA polymerase-3 subunit gamma/tau
MSEFIVSARKYRPQTFEDVVGQQHITSTLKNAIRTGKVAHALLFCGPRGVGKTTSARIMAKTLNCLNLQDNFEPCNTCESCQAFNTSHSFNIHELDAASNNSVDDIRILIEQVRIIPQIGKYSIYIIDEVHMLSQQAFNAFLKTLEEPPAHAIFILATTEKHKILPTILSRCQVFDFKRITIDDIAKHLAVVATKENITVEPDTLYIIAQKADGALRDALSIFDRMVTFCGNNLKYEDIIENLNILDYDYYFKIIDGALSENYQDLLILFNQVLNNGFDGQHFNQGLAEHLRNLLVCRDTKTTALLETGENTREKYLKQAQSCEVEFLFEALKISNQTDLNYRNASNKRLLIELMLLQLAGLKKKLKPTG